jgi:uncharacterized membrane protein YphA (DoxX/SURF4 family)
MEKISPAILRIGMSLVFIWFGYNQLVDTQSWIAYIPDWVMSSTGLKAEMLVQLNGIFELVFGGLLLLGVLTRYTAFILMVHMINITYLVGFDSIGVRDFGLSIATIVIWLNGRDFLTIDTVVIRRSVSKKNQSSSLDSKSVDGVEIL